MQATGSNSHFEHGGSDASDMAAWPAVCLLSVSWSVRVGWCCCTLLIRADAASLCARTRGEPSSAHCEQRLSERLTPRPCDPVCACTGMRGHAGKGKSGQTTQRGDKEPLHSSSAYPHAAQRAVPGWRGGLGRVGADLASAGSMRPPPSPARHVSTAWLATTNVSREAAARQAKTGSSPHPPAEKQHATTQARQETAPHRTLQPRSPTGSCKTLAWSK